uniref:integumentary mucin C.1-like n=1 Tax=Styela clava TaxID=7725 RepID=UPI00193A1380|nr:integumentary mucin C.1-like [Styela clava]XP_039269549.1 integumentary mucin C.1-like [Styela clava]
MFCLWTLSLVLLSTISCTSAAIEDCKCWISILKRTPCKTVDWFSSKEDCESVGCCHDDVTSLFALGWKGRCYEKSGKCPKKECQVSPAQRKQVGYRAIGKRRCKRLGGCFDESRQDPQCYKKRSPEDLKFRTTTELSPRTTVLPSVGYRTTDMEGLALEGPIVKIGEFIKAQMLVEENPINPATLTQKKKTDSAKRSQKMKTNPTKSSTAAIMRSTTTPTNSPMATSTESTTVNDQLEKFTTANSSPFISYETTRIVTTKEPSKVNTTVVSQTFSTHSSKLSDTSAFTSTNAINQSTIPEPATNLTAASSTSSTNAIYTSSFATKNLTTTTSSSVPTTPSITSSMTLSLSIISSTNSISTRPVSTQNNASSTPLTSTSTSSTSTTSPITSSFVSTSNPTSVKPTHAPGYYGPNGIYEMGGFTLLAQCPSEDQEKRDCTRRSVTKESCYKQFCCWKEPNICHLPTVKTLHWKKSNKSFGWTSWGAWSRCPDATSCTLAKQTRSRRCQSKINCVGKNEETRNCAVICQASWSEWGEWTTCSDSCGPGVTERARLCLRMGIIASTSSCLGGYKGSSESKPCNTDLCSQWSSWSSGLCPAECGSSGIGVQERTCNEKGKSTGEKQCSIKVKICKGLPCTNIKQQTAEWSTWSKWSSCSNSCGIGTRRRKRACSTMDGLIATQNVRVFPGQMTPCIGGNSATIEEQTCNEDLCLSWSKWSAPKPCSALCGGGTKDIIRTCTKSGFRSIPPSCSRTRVRCRDHQCPK